MQLFVVNAHSAIRSRFRIGTGARAEHVCTKHRRHFCHHTSRLNSISTRRYIDRRAAKQSTRLYSMRHGDPGDCVSRAQRIFTRVTWSRWSACVHTFLVQRLRMRARAPLSFPLWVFSMRSLVQIKYRLVQIRGALVQIRPLFLYLQSAARGLGPSGATVCTRAGGHFASYERGDATRVDAHAHTYIRLFAPYVTSLVAPCAAPRAVWVAVLCSARCSGSG